MAVVTPTERPKSVRNRCLIEDFGGVCCVVNLPVVFPKVLTKNIDNFQVQ